MDTYDVIDIEGFSDCIYEELAWLEGTIHSAKLHPNLSNILYRCVARYEAPGLKITALRQETTQRLKHFHDH